MIGKSVMGKKPTDMLENHIAKEEESKPASELDDIVAEIEEKPIDDRTKDEIEKDDANLYDISNFSV